MTCPSLPQLRGGPASIHTPVCHLQSPCSSPTFIVSRLFKPHQACWRSHPFLLPQSRSATYFMIPLPLLPRGPWGCQGSRRWCVRSYSTHGDRTVPGGEGAWEAQVWIGHRCAQRGGVLLRSAGRRGLLGAANSGWTRSEADSRAGRGVCCVRVGLKPRRAQLSTRRAQSME